MSEEKVGFFDEFKKQILAGVSLVITAGAGIVTTQFEALFGTEEEAAPVEQVIQQPTQPQNITINLSKQKEQKKDTVVKKVYVKPKPKKTETEKRKDDGFDW